MPTSILAPDLAAPPKREHAGVAFNVLQPTCTPTLADSDTRPTAIPERLWNELVDLRPTLNKRGSVHAEPLPGLVLLLAGLGMAFTFTLGKTASGFTAAWMRLRKPVALALSGLLILAAGVVGIVLGYKRGKVVYRHPKAMTRGSMYGLAERISANLNIGEPVPTDLDALLRERSEESRDRLTQDGWFQRLVVREDDKGRYSIISKGPDGSLDTDDDIVKGVEAGKKVEY